MNRQRLILIITGVVVLIILPIVVIVAVNRNPKLQNIVSKAANINRATTANTNSTVTTVSADPQAKDRQAVIFVARNFAERFGSTSNQNNFANFISAETYGTTSFNDSLNRSIAQQKLTLKTTPFQSTITKALTISVKSLTSSSASVAVTAQRQETIDQATRVYYQDLILEMLKVGADWKVNAASWKVS